MRGYDGPRSSRPPDVGVAPFGSDPSLDGRTGSPCYRAGVDAHRPHPHRTAPIQAEWLGRDRATATPTSMQRRLAAERADGVIGDRLLLLEHPAVLTLGRNSDPAHILASEAELAARGIEVVRVERGGEVTYHGPGQLVAYPIVALHERGLLLRPFVRALEAALVATCAAFGVDAGRARRPPRLLVRPGRPDAAQDRRARPARRARRHLPRHRAQRQRRPRRLRADRRRAGCPASSRPRSPASSETARRAPRSTASVERAAWVFARGARDGHRRAAPSRGPEAAVAAGLFELRKDPITGWWVATVVDRQFHLDRFARAAEPVDDRLFGCANCTTPAGDGVRTRMLKDFAFHVVGTDDDARVARPGPRPGRARPGARDRQLADGRGAAGRAPAAPRRRQPGHRGAADGGPRRHRRGAGRRPRPST